MSLKKKAAEGAVEGAASEVSRRVVGAAILAIPFYGAAIVAFAQENIIVPICTYPLAFCAIFVFGGLFGFAVGMLLRHKSLSKVAELERVVAEKDNQILTLSKSLASITEDNAEMLALNDEDPQHVNLCREVLGVFVKFKDEPHRIESYIREQLAGGVVQNVSFGEAFNDLIKYGCVSGCALYSGDNGRYCLFRDTFDHELVNEMFPSFLDRKLKDNELQPMTAEDVDRIIKECERQAKTKEVLRKRGLAI